MDARFSVYNKKIFLNIDWFLVCLQKLTLGKRQKILFYLNLWFDFQMWRYAFLLGKATSCWIDPTVTAKKKKKPKIQTKISYKMISTWDIPDKLHNNCKTYFIAQNLNVFINLSCYINLGWACCAG